MLKRLQVLLVLCFYFLIAFSFPAFSIEFSKENLFQLGTLASKEGEHEQAIMLYKKSIELDPKFIPAYNRLGLVYETSPLADLDEAIRYFRLAADIDPASIESWNNLGRAYYSKGDFVQAEKALQKSLAAAPDQPEIAITLGWVYLLGESKGREAAEYFLQGLEQRENPSAYYGLGLAYIVQDERLKVFDAITQLRQRDQEQLALRLEMMLKQNIQLTSTPGQPLVTGVEPPPSIFTRQLEASGGASEVDVDASSEGIQVRLRGALEK